MQVFEKTKRRASSSRKLHCNSLQYGKTWITALPEDIRTCVNNGYSATSALRYAVFHRATVEKINTALEMGGDPDSKRYGRTLLYDAVGYRNTEAVKALLAGGANVNARHDDTSTHRKRWTALHLASSNSQRTEW